MIVADVYAAGEAPIEGFGKDELVAGLQSHGHRNAYGLDAPEALASLISTHAVKGDIIMCLGAGTITNWAASLPAELEAIISKGGA